MRVLHLTGSSESQFWADLSLVYARGALSAIADPGDEAVIAYVDPAGGWRFPDALDAGAVAAAPLVGVGDAVARLVALAPDVAVPQLFDRSGMTHHRALLDLLGIPYVGNPPDVMALTADKALARAVVAAAGIAVPDGEVLRRGETPTLAPPLVVKPVEGDNSDGVSLVRPGEDAGPALEAALAHGDRVLVERYVELGREVRCGVLEQDGDLVCLPLEAYAVDASHPVRVAADKLARDEGGALRLMAKDAASAWVVDAGDPDVPAVHAAARVAYRALGCRDYGLFDFRIDPDGRPWFLEAGLYCSFADSSVVCVMARAAGISARELFTRTVTNALETR